MAPVAVAKVVPSGEVLEKIAEIKTALESGGAADLVFDGVPRADRLQVALGLCRCRRPLYPD